MRVLRLSVTLVVLAVATGCGEGGTATRDMRRAINGTESRPYRYVYTETAGGRTVKVKVTVEDSFRSRTELSMDGVPLLDQVVVDDAAALRVQSPERWNPAAGTPLASVVGSGDWIVDPAGAPELLLSEESSGDITEVGTDVVSDAINALDYAQAAADQANDVVKFDENSIFYRPSEDPFRDLVEADERAGLTRYDAVPPVLPRTQEGQRGGQQLPGTPVFRRLSVYVKDGRVVRILEDINFETHPELVKAKQQGRPRFLLQMIEDLRKGIGDDPIRPRRMSLEIETVEEGLEVEMPSEGSTANVGELLASDALSDLPDASGLGERKEGG